ncbi:MAG: hypothetical protein UV18_C0005G0047 [Candidatus Magasanikbacteria bacterium GW2011_GWC2_42_27]|nr:MAG: hypothetical protein UV18_C0005G0047 [Candidatus Magasanikbacteria bacterium GW2011_GWC2_42_27]
MKYSLGWYLGLLVGLMIGLNMLGQIFSTLDQRYMQSYGEQIVTDTMLPVENSFVESYAFEQTPYYLPYVVSFYVAFFLPIALVLFWSVRYLLQERTFRRFLFSFSFPAMYAVVNIGYYEFGMAVVGYSSGVLCITVGVVNSMLLVRSKKHISS